MRDPESCWMDFKAKTDVSYGYEQKNIVLTTLTVQPTTRILEYVSCQCQKKEIKATLDNLET